MSDDEKRDTSVFEIAMAVIGVVGAVAGLFSGMGAGPEMKTMKAPGKDGRIFRKAFESDPKGYFQNLLSVCTAVTAVGAAAVGVVGTAVAVAGAVTAVNDAAQKINK
ncbi:unnamed protein product [Brassica oleracea var. botrytis]|uniref:Uncharacterized protein n=2 Tax=Brassica TaxID=3705 RepID=A0A3P6F225_BRAOL|nr:unnamed protein product [Brassica napus]VDD38362.1 unnamed protein product [Brassica oleracea]